MANRINNWRELLELANKDLENKKAEIGVYEDNGEYSVTVVTEGKEEEYANGYYEDELSGLINDAWVHVRAKINAEKSEQNNVTSQTINMNVSVTLNITEEKTKEEIEGLAYWLMYNMLEDHTKQYPNGDIKSFDITID